MIVAAPYLTPATQLDAQLRAMVRAGDKLSPEQRQRLQDELHRIYEGLKALRERYERETGQLIPVEPPFEG